MPMTRRSALVRTGAASGGLGAAVFVAAYGSATTPVPAQAAVQGKAMHLLHTANETQVEGYRYLAGMYQQRNPSAQIEVTPTPAGENHPAKLIAMASAGDPPETTFVNGYFLVEYAERGMLEALDPLVARDKVDMKRFFEKTVELTRWTVKGQQQLYAVPLHPNPAVLQRTSRSAGSGSSSFRPRRRTSTSPARESSWAP